MALKIAVALICSLPILLPLILVLKSVDKSSRRYRFCWWGLVGVTATACLSTTFFFMGLSYYFPDENPFDPGGDLLSRSIIFVLVAAIIAPSFVALFLLGFFPPNSYSPSKQRVIRSITRTSVIILAGVVLILLKYHSFIQDL